ncbi:MAG: hypothetical protein ACJ74T_07920 [Pyrinomonadaceae bacterium]
MDPFTLVFVGGLCCVAFLLTVAVRRELRAKERQRREERRQSQGHNP